jgi:hypothetical protein
LDSSGKRRKVYADCLTVPQSSPAADATAACANLQLLVRAASIAPRITRSSLPRDDAAPGAICPICETFVPCDSGSVDWDKRFSSATCAAFEKHCLIVHANELLWNCLPRPRDTDYNKHGFTEEATLSGTIHVSLYLAAEKYFYYCAQNEGPVRWKTWEEMKSAVILCIGFAFDFFKDTDEAVIGADPKPSLNKRSSFRKSHAIQYLSFLYMYVVKQATPGPLWEQASSARRINAFRNFFCEADRHISCLVLFYPWNDWISCLKVIYPHNPFSSNAAEH